MLQQALLRNSLSRCGARQVCRKTHGCQSRGIVSKTSAEKTTAEAAHHEGKWPSLSLGYFSPFAEKHLVFNTFPRHTGGATTLGTFVAINVGVFIAWRWALVQAEVEGDETLLDFMSDHFVGSNSDTSKPENWHKILFSSISHQDFGHLAGNMTMFLLLGSRLHEFLGRARFLLLMLMGSIGGTVATQACHLDPYWEAHRVAESPARYMNILQGESPGQARGLGASDIVSAMFAAFYLTFPRQPVPFLWFKTHLAWRLIPQALKDRVPMLGAALRRTNAAAIWVLPAYFLVDFQKIYEGLTDAAEEDDSLGLMRGSNVGHAAHVGGFTFGALFYALVAHPLKRQYFKFTPYERYRLFYKMTLSMSFWYFILKWIPDKVAERLQSDASSSTKNVFVIEVNPNEREFEEETSEDGGPTPWSELDKEFFDLWESDEKLRELVFAARGCSATESCSQPLHQGKCSQCDDYFQELRQYLEQHFSSPRLGILHYLNPNYVDSFPVCRTLLQSKEWGVRKVHEDYHETEPQLRLVSIPFGRKRDIGLGVVDEDGIVTVQAVQPSSIAAGCDMENYLGYRITYANYQQVENLEHLRQIVADATKIDLWLQQPLPQGARPGSTRRRRQPKGDSTSAGESGVVLNQGEANKNGIVFLSGRSSIWPWR
mmetsp:Transcript_52561/g.112086  ORF Transcript_52561/g.112086 Transcript_52561/m.112086 type:complete len:657 (-) Transcript_52561:71-2041(-)